MVITGLKREVKRKNNFFFGTRNDEKKREASREECLELFFTRFALKTLDEIFPGTILPDRKRFLNRPFTRRLFHGDYP